MSKKVMRLLLVALLVVGLIVPTAVAGAAGSRVATDSAGRCFALGLGFYVAGVDVLLPDDGEGLDSKGRVVYNGTDAPERVFVDDDTVGAAGVYAKLGAGADVYCGSNLYSDWVWGQSGIDFIVGNGGHDKLFGGTENDFLFGGAGNDAIFGQADNDTIVGDAGNDRLRGKAGNDVIIGNQGNDNIKGQDGNDRLAGGGGIGAEGYADGFVNVAAATADGDQVADGNDKIAGGAGNDFVMGGNGADELFGGTGNDCMLGGLMGTVAPDTALTGACRLAAGGLAVPFGFNGWSGDPAAARSLSIANPAAVGYIIAPAGDVYFDGPDWMVGGDGNDDMFGDAGDDTLWGKAGNDRLFGGAGQDTMSCGFTPGDPGGFDVADGSAASGPVAFVAATDVPQIQGVDTSLDQCEFTGAEIALG